MLDKLFGKIASLKTSWSEKPVKYRSSRSPMFFKIAVKILQHSQENICAEVTCVEVP